MSAFPSTATISSALALITTGTPYLALYTNNPGPGNTGTELTGGSYARQAITFAAPVGSSVSNSATVNFSGLPTSTVTHYGVLSASSGGTLRVYGELNSSVAVVTDDEIVFNVSGITFSLTGS